MDTSSNQRVTLTITSDEGTESPGAWDDVLALHVGKGDRHYHWLAADNLACSNCRLDATDHPMEEEHANSCPKSDDDEATCDDTVYCLPKCDAFSFSLGTIPVIWDNRGPYSTITIIDTSDAEEVRDWIDSDGRDTYRSYFLLSDDEGNQKWWESLPDTHEDDKKPWSHDGAMTYTKARAVSSTVETWKQWAQGDVWSLRVERETLADCGHWEASEDEYLCGVYSSDYASSYDAWSDMGVSKEEFDTARKVGSDGRDDSYPW